MTSLYSPYPGLHRIFYDGDYDELRRTLLFLIVIACPSCCPTPRYRLRRVYDIHIVLRRMYNS